MPAKAPIYVTTSAFLVVALGFGWLGFRSAHRTQASLSTLDLDLARQDADMRLLRAQISERQRDAAALKVKLGKAQSAKGGPKTAATNKNPPAKDPATLMASNAKLRALYLESFRANLAQRYGSMYRSLGFTQVQIDKFEDLATAHADDVVTMRAAALAQGLTLSDPGFTVLEKQELDQFYRTVADEMGATVSQQVVQLARMQDVQSIVDTISNETALGSARLTGPQGAQLAQILANASASFENGGNADRYTINWDNVYDQAAALLSEPQFDAFKYEAAGIRFRQMLNQFESQQQPTAP